MHAKRVFLALGSNLGDKQKNIATAYENIEKKIGNIVSLSSLYITTPEGFDSENMFVNSVCEVQTELNLTEILTITQQIEKKIGRTSKSENLHYSDRVIDIDLLFADNLIIDTPELSIPHPRMHKRDFVLVPLCEIAPEVVHPVLKKKISELLVDLRSNS